MAASLKKLTQEPALKRRTARLVVCYILIIAHHTRLPLHNEKNRLLKSTMSMATLSYEPNVYLLISAITSEPPRNRSFHTASVAR